MRAGKERSLKRGNAFEVFLTLPRDEAVKLVEGLAREGFLRDAQSGVKDKVMGQIGYVMDVRNEKYTQREIFGADEQARVRLESLSRLLQRWLPAEMRPRAPRAK